MIELDEAEFGAVLRGIKHTAFRLEVQPAYSEPCEDEIVSRFIAGNLMPGPDVPELAAWFDQVRAQTAEGKRVERVRVQQDPPTRYQEFERWLDQWNLAAGERIRYMTVQRAHEIGLLPAAGGSAEWWLLDSTKLLVMRFDGLGHRVHNQLISRPESVLRACYWRDLAVHYSTEARLSDVAA